MKNVLKLAIELENGLVMAPALITMKFVENLLNQNPYLIIASMINGYVEIFVSVKIYHAMVLVTVFQVSNITDGNAMIN